MFRLAHDICAFIDVFICSSLGMVGIPVPPGGLVLVHWLFYFRKWFSFGPLYLLERGPAIFDEYCELYFWLFLHPLWGWIALFKIYNSVFAIYDPIIFGGFIATAVCGWDVTFIYRLFVLLGILVDPDAEGTNTDSEKGKDV